VRSTRVFHVLGGVSARRLRGLSLLGSLLIALAVSPLAALSVLPWWSVVVVVAVLMVDLAGLRRAAVSQHAHSRAAERLRGSAAGRAAAAADADAAEDSSRSQPRPGAESRSEVYGDAESEVESEPVAEDPVAAVAEQAEAPAEVDPHGWAPIPVPPPTYTLKAMAPEPVVVPVATELAASESWSLDGLVYDCDLDELVERRSATGA
jgi:hypothetical protein